MIKFVDKHLFGLLSCYILTAIIFMLLFAAFEVIKCSSMVVLIVSTVFLWLYEIISFVKWKKE